MKMIELASVTINFKTSNKRWQRIRNSNNEPFYLLFETMANKGHLQVPSHRPMEREKRLGHLKRNPQLDATAWAQAK